MEKPEKKPIIISPTCEELLCCPFCFEGVTFHKTYGSEKKCIECKGKGHIKKSTLKALNMEI